MTVVEVATNERTSLGDDIYRPKFFHIPRQPAPVGAPAVAFCGYRGVIRESIPAGYEECPTCARLWAIS